MPGNTTVTRGALSSNSGDPVGRAGSICSLNPWVECDDDHRTRRERAWGRPTPELQQRNQVGRRPLLGGYPVPRQETSVRKPAHDALEAELEAEPGWG